MTQVERLGKLNKVIQINLHYIPVRILVAAVLLAHQQIVLVIITYAIKEFSKKYIEELLHQDDNLFNQVSERRESKKRGRKTGDKNKQHKGNNNRDELNRSSNNVICEVEVLRSPSNTTVFTKALNFTRQDTLPLQSVPGDDVVMRELNSSSEVDFDSDESGLNNSINNLVVGEYKHEKD